MTLYHFSEAPGITTRFVPRRPDARPDVEPLVWAIDAWHAPIYYVPRDCPRVCFWPVPATTPEDLDRWYGGIEARMVVTIESAWLARLRACTLYRYELPEAPFTSLNDAGMHVTRAAVEPLGVVALPDLPGAFRDDGVELRVTPSLVGLARRIMASTLHFSLIRMRNAEGWDAPPSLPPDLSGVPETGRSPASRPPPAALE